MQYWLKSRLETPANRLFSEKLTACIITEEAEKTFKTPFLGSTTGINKASISEQTCSLYKWFDNFSEKDMPFFKISDSGKLWQARVLQTWFRYRSPKQIRAFTTNFKLKMFLHASVAKRKSNASFTKYMTWFNSKD